MATKRFRGTMENARNNAIEKNHPISIDFRNRHCRGVHDGVYTEFGRFLIVWPPHGFAFKKQTKKCHTISPSIT